MTTTYKALHEHSLAHQHGKIFLLQRTGPEDPKPCATEFSDAGAVLKFCSDLMEAAEKQWPEEMAKFGSTKQPPNGEEH